MFSCKKGHFIWFCHFVVLILCPKLFRCVDGKMRKHLGRKSKRATQGSYDEWVTTVKQIKNQWVVFFKFHFLTYKTSVLFRRAELRPPDILSVVGQIRHVINTWHALHVFMLIINGYYLISTHPMNKNVRYNARLELGWNLYVQVWSISYLTQIGQSSCVCVCYFYKWLINQKWTSFLWWLCNFHGTRTRTNTYY